MTTTELRDYIAVSAMNALLVNEHMALEKLTTLNTNPEEDAVELARSITQAAYNMAEEMMLEKEQRDKGMRRATMEELRRESTSKIAEEDGGSEV